MSEDTEHQCGVQCLLIVGLPQSTQRRALRQTVHFACSSLREAGSCEVQILVASTARADIDKRTQVRFFLHYETCRHMLSEAKASAPDHLAQNFRPKLSPAQNLLAPKPLNVVPKKNCPKLSPKTFAQNFRPKLSPKTFRPRRFAQNLLAPKPLTISINPKP